MTRPRNPYRRPLSFSLCSTASTSALVTTTAAVKSSKAQLGESTQLHDFEVVGLVGRGAFGKVYSVNHRALHTKYALKCLSKRRVVQKCMATNVLKELDISQQLNHTFIIKLWFTFQDEDYIYIISDLLTGGDLRVHLKTQGRFSEPRAKLYICEIALALDYLHRRNIAHRDLKPENIILDTRGHAHVADLNLAIRLTDQPDGLATTFTGTRLYMAPEILLTALCESVGYDHRVDWWSLGICFFEMLHGRRPFEFPDSFSTPQVLRLITGNFGMPAHWTTDLRAFITNLMQTSPTQRIDCLEEFRKHEYMERINLKHVLHRRTAPVYVPKAEAMPRRAGLLSGGDSADDKSTKRLRNSSPLSLRLKRRNSKSSLFHVDAYRSRKADGANSTTAIDAAPKQIMRRYSAIGSGVTCGAAVSEMARRVSTPWSAELAHLTLSFRGFNRFCAPPPLDDGDVTRRLPKSAVKSPSGLLLSQSVRALDRAEARARSRTPPYGYQALQSLTSHFMQRNAAFMQNGGDKL